MPSPQQQRPAFTVDSDGNFYFGSWNGVLRRSRDGSILNLGMSRPGRGTGFEFPIGMVFDANRNLYVAEQQRARVYVLSEAATCSGTPASSPLRFKAITPCRLVETRDGSRGDFGTPSLTAGQVRTFRVPDVSACAIPSTAMAYSLNATVVAPGVLSYLTLFPTGSAQPFVSTLNAPLGGIVANNAIVPVGTNGDISVFSTDTTDLVLDVNGYFGIGSNGERDGFTPLNPCRVIDTRMAAGPLGGPELSSTRRVFALDQSPCLNTSITPDALAFNITIVPDEPVGYLTLWPYGSRQPLASTLNSPDGRIIANGAIVPSALQTNQSSGIGSIDVFSTNRTNLVADVNGYFAPYTGFSFYPVTPCRIADTRNPTGPLGGPAISGGTSRDFPVVSANCNIPASAQAYAVNVTAVPHGMLNYLTIWPTGQTQPFVSTLNSLDGRIVANGAIVPAGRNGAISVYATDTTDVVIDINGYFAE